MEKEKKSELSQHEAAIESSNHQLPVAIETDNEIAQKSAYMSYITMAEEYEKTKHFPQAMQCYEVWLKNASTDDVQQIGNVYLRLGHIYQEMEENHKALTCYEKALEIAQHLSDQTLEVKLYINLGHFHFTQGNFQQSSDYYKKELELAITLDDIKSDEVANYKLGLWYKHLGDYAKDIQYQEKALRIAVGMGDKKAEATAYRSLGDVYQIKLVEDHHKAIYCYEKALKIDEEIDGRDVEFHCYLVVGNLHQSLGHHDDAIKFFKKFLVAAIEDNNTEYQKRAYLNMAGEYDNLKDFHQVINCYEEWLKIASTDDEERGDVFLNLGAAYQNLKDFDQAIKYYEKSLEIAQKQSDQGLQIKLYNNLGSCFFSQEEFLEASDYYVKYLELAIKLDDKTLQIQAYRLLGCLCSHTGDYAKAIEHYQKGLTVAIEIDDKEGEAKACENLGDVQIRKGDYNEAIKFHEQQLQISINSGSKDGQARAYRKLATDYQNSTNQKELIKSREKVLEMCVESGDKEGEARAGYKLGVTYQSLNQYQKAIDLHKKSLEIIRQIGCRVLEGKVNSCLGECFNELDKYNNAVEHYKESLKIALEVNDKISEGRAYSSLGACKIICREYNEALELFDKQIRLSEDMKDKELEYSAHVYKAMVHKYLGDTEQEIYHCEKSFEIEKAISCSKNFAIPSNFNLQGILYSEMALSYELKGEEEKKEQCISKSVHSFDESLKLEELKFEQLPDQDHFKISFLEKMPYKEASLMLFFNNDNKNGLLISERGRARALNDLLVSKFNLNRSQLRSDPITYDEIENMSSDYSILFYICSLAEDDSCFIISCPVNLSSPLLPRVVRAKLSEILGSTYHSLKVREVQCEDRSVQTDQEQQDFSVSQQKLRAMDDFSEELLLSTCEMIKNRCIVEEDLYDDDNPSPLEGLYKSLISPVLDNLTKDEIVIVPDGDLFKVPFAALRDPNTGEFLSQTKRIRLAPSLTSLKMLQESPADYHSKTGALIIGNPKVGEVMFRGEKRVITDLPCAEQEAEMIGELLGIKPFIGSQATKEVIKQNLREGVAIIHFAAHGTTDGEIFLAPSTPGDFPSEQDYILTMKDVQESGVRPQLVVLSCCHSGRGEIKAEGVVGMSRAFLAAGAHAVVASLWAIADEGTMVFMEQFYTHLRQGKSASRSLQQAMKDMRELPKYSDPQFWAPFFLIGDDVTITMWD